MPVEKRKREGESLVVDDNSTESFSRSLPTEFPRGGGTGIAPVDIKRAAAEATNDVFESMRQSKKVKKTKKSSGNAVVALQQRIEPLLLHKIKEGTLILGQVIKPNYTTNELEISLPNNLTGFVKLDTPVNDRLNNKFLRFIVTGLGAEGKRKHLSLSYDPTLVNQVLDQSELTQYSSVQGIVKSVEEKGLVLDLGEQLNAGFLPLKSTNNHEVGEPVLAFVVEPERRIMLLTADPSVSIATVLRQPALVPGTLIKSAPTEKETAFGDLYSLLGTYTASADAVHNRDRDQGVRVLFSFPPTQINGDRQLGVTSLTHLIDLDTDAGNTSKLGDIEQVKVVRASENLGLQVEGPHGPGFVHISQLSSEKINLDDTDEFKAGTNHLGRVIGISKIDGLAYYSLNQSVLEQQYLSFQDVKIGDVVKNAKIDRILPKGGVLIKLADNVVGIANEFQLSDAAVKNPELRFKVGNKVACRVLNVDTERLRIELTMKKSIVEDEEPILDGYDASPGWRVGTVLRIIEAGAKILFFGNVRGLLPIQEMSETDVKPEDLLRVGQTVRCRVLSADASNDKLIVSMRPKSELDGHVGEVHNAVITIANKHEVHCQVTLSESLIGEAILVGDKKAKVGSEIVVKVLNNRMVCANESIVQHELPSSANNLEIGSRVYGFVSGSHPQAGVFIGFQNQFAGLIPANVLGTKKWPLVGTVMEVQVDSIDFAKNRAFLSLPSTEKQTVEATITAVKATQVNITTNDGQQGRIDSSLMFNSIDEIEDVSKPLDQFHTNQKLSGLTVVGRHDSKNHKYLPLSHKTGTHVVLEVAKAPLTTNFTVGSTALGFLNNYSADKLSAWVTLSPQIKAQISLVDLSDDLDVLSNVEQYFPVGCALNLKILKTGPKMSVTALQNPSNLALVCAVDKLKVTVRLPNHKTQTVDCCDCLDEFEKLKSKFEIGQILKFHKVDNRISLKSNNEPVNLEKGSIVKGYVRNVSPGGVFVALTSKTVGRVLIKNLSDVYLKDWQKFVAVGDVVVGKVLSNENDKKIELTLKPSAVTGKKQPNITNTEVGEVYVGNVRSVAAFGVFVDFNNVTGLAHKSEISDRVIEDLNRVFKAGDEVKVKVLAKDETTGRISVGMKAAYFGDDSDAEITAVDVDEAGMDSDGSHVSFSKFDDDSDAMEIDAQSESESDNDSGSGSDSDSDSDADAADADADADAAPLSAGFDWSGDLPLATNADAFSDSDSESEDEDRKHRKKRSKKEEFVRDETANLQSRLPQSAKDFERRLVSEPNNSMLWMNYMAFELQLGEVDNARSIAKRALKTISQREEVERMNIWVAMLNLEARFGTTEQLNNTFRESQQFMDALTMHFKMATVLAQAGQVPAAIEIYKRAQKKFGSENMEVWLQAMKFLFSELGNDKNSAREMAERAMQRLPARLHKDLTRQFALLEYESGDPERARTLFEALVSSAPKRIDIWNVYVDQEIKHSDETKFAALFERIFQQKLSMKQAKFFFKKWISVASDQEYVTMRAKEYVESREAPEQSQSDISDSDSEASE